MSTWSVNVVIFAATGIRTLETDDTKFMFQL